MRALSVTNICISEETESYPVTCKNGKHDKNKTTKKGKTTQTNKKPNHQPAVSVRGKGETYGEKRVKRPKHSCVELHQEV